MNAKRAGRGKRYEEEVMRDSNEQWDEQFGMPEDAEQVQYGPIVFQLICGAVLAIWLVCMMFGWGK